MAKRDDEIHKRGTAIMIGSIASFEKHFGYLWGHEKYQDEPLTDIEDEFLDLWEKTRTEVLDKGNDQIKQLRRNMNNNGQY